MPPPLKAQAPSSSCMFATMSELLSLSSRELSVMPRCSSTTSLDQVSTLDLDRLSGVDPKPMPLPLEKLQAVKTIISHENCADGTAAAMFLHDVLPDAKIRFVQYGDAQRNLQAEPGMLFCDFSPHPETFQQFIDQGALILDHHKGAQAIVEAFGESGVFGDEILDPGVCGAFLAYREVWFRLKHTVSVFGSEIARLAGVRDTWQRQDPTWDEACVLAEAMRFYPAESWLIANPFAPENREWWEARLATGRILVERSAKSVQKAVDVAYRFTTSRGTRCVLFSGVRLSSDAAELVGKDADLVVGFDYYGIEKGQINLVFSTRSHTDFDCLKLCKSQGGGGHTQAAGFSIKSDLETGNQDPYTVFEATLEWYEATLP